MSEASKDVKDIVPIEKFDEFVRDLNGCIPLLKGKRLDKPIKYKFCKKVRKIVARYFNVKFSETKVPFFEEDGNDLLVKYPFADDALTLMRFEIREVK